MAKVMSQSNRIYYRECLPHEVECIHHDLKLYNTMMHDAYDKKYRMEFCNLNLDKPLYAYLKEKYGTNDYPVLAAINQAAGILSGNKEAHKLHVKEQKQRIKGIEKKIKETERKLKHFRNMKESLIRMSRAEKAGKKLPKFCNYKGSGIQWNQGEPDRFLVKEKEYSRYLFEV